MGREEGRLRTGGQRGGRRKEEEDEEEEEEEEEAEGEGRRREIKQPHPEGLGKTFFMTCEELIHFPRSFFLDGLGSSTIAPRTI